MVSPYTGGVLGTVPDSDLADVARVVSRARTAAVPWAHTPIKERTSLLFRFRALVHEHLEELAQCVACESGKTLGEARAGLLKGLEVVEYATSLQNLPAGGALEVSQGVLCEAHRVPLGVVCGITPFNFPAMVPMWMFPIAVTLGNAFILKPSEKVPLTATRLAELMRDAGYPEGVLSVVHGGSLASEALIDHPDISAVGFVGSTPVARRVYARAAAHGKRVLALGGAKNPMILMPDADPDVAITGVVSSFTGCAGQRCMAGSVLLAVGTCDDLVDGILRAASEIRLGTDMGALIDQHARARLLAAIEQAAADGAAIRLDGRCATPPVAYPGGFWLGPTVLDNVTPQSAAARQELFGPVLSIVRVSTLEDALSFEAESCFGNAVSVFTRDGSVARAVALGCRSGMVGVNVGVPVPREPFSFGGTRDSRFGSGDITGAGGVAFWSDLRKITSKWAPAVSGGWMS